MLEYIKWLAFDAKGKSFSHLLILWNNQICLVSTQKKLRHIQRAIYVLNYVYIDLYIQTHTIYAIYLQLKEEKNITTDVQNEKKKKKANRNKHARCPLISIHIQWICNFIRFLLLFYTKTLVTRNKMCSLYIIDKHIMHMLP